MFVSEVEFMLHKKQLNRVIKIQELKTIGKRNKN